MTATKGMLWKTAWKHRTGGFVDQPTVGMWFFDLSGGGAGFWRYQAAAALPTFSGTDPWWCGIVCYSGVTSASVARLDAGVAPGNGFSITVSSSIGPLPPDVPAPSPAERQDFSTLVNAALGAAEISNGSPVLVYNFNTVSVYLMRVHVVSGQIQGEIFADNALLKAFPTLPAAGPYVPPASPFRFQCLTAGINGIVGGPGYPTDAQIADWFNAVRDAQDIQPMPGMTSDLWSAKFVAPAAPAVLPNLAGGQVLTLTPNGAPTPASNNLIQVSFNY